MDSKEVNLKENYLRVCENLAPYRDRTKLIAVSKTKPFSDIYSLYQLGHRDFGENYTQELFDKIALAKKASMSEIRWHLIGAQQSNKAKGIAEHRPLFHALDSIGIAKKIEKSLVAIQQHLECFVQVNIDRESSKQGILPENLINLLEQLKITCPSIKLKGLMCIPDPKSPSDIAFERMKKLSEDTRPFHDGQLSMGMSHDYLIAAKHGATYVRVGTVIFGERSK